MDTRTNFPALDPSDVNAAINEGTLTLFKLFGEVEMASLMVKVSLVLPTDEKEGSKCTPKRGYM